jgi:hypothetical protein
VRTASFSVENLFERAKALAEEDWNKGKPAPRGAGDRANEAALALLAARGLAGVKTRDVGAQTLRRVAEGYGLSGVASALVQHGT